MGCQFPLTDLCLPPGKEGGRGRVASEYMVAEMCNAPLGNCPLSPIYLPITWQKKFKVVMSH